MKHILQLSSAFVLAVCIAGCASDQAPQAKFSGATVAAIKTGMMKSDVTTMLGEPRSRSVDNEGNEI